VDIVRRSLAAVGAQSVLDAGCGPASMLRELVDLGLERYGFDLTPEMVVEARRVLGTQGVPAERVWEGSVTDPAAFRSPPDSAGYDAAICFGVLPHIRAEDDARVLENLVNSVRPGGLILAEARNVLFALFTLNRYSRDLFRSALIDVDRLRAQATAEELPKLDEALALVDKQFRLDLPPVRKGKSGEPGYDEVLSRTHNPFVVRDLAARHGLVDVEILFYHYHCLPPMFERELPELYRRQSVAMEDPRDWRGHFMASAFIVCGKRP
jgi:SAM-dependent methyltransferase